MSWSFSHRSKDKEKLRAACVNSMNETNRFYETREMGNALLGPVLSVLLASIDAAIIPPGANYLEVICNGHMDTTQRYFTIKIEPVYLPKTLDDLN